jgi:hypothetical protein
VGEELPRFSHDSHPVILRRNGPVEQPERLKIMGLFRRMGATEQAAKVVVY